MRFLPVLLLSAAAAAQAAPNEALKPMDFLYVENSGGHSRGTMKPSDTGLDFPETRFIVGGKELPYRAHWTTTPDAYEAVNEMYFQDKWVTQFKMLLKKQ